MHFDEFLLDRWLQDRSGPGIRFDLGGSTGPLWRLRDVLALDGEDAAECLLDLQLAYSKTAGAEGLRSAIAAMAGVPSEQVVVLAGAAEYLTNIFLLAAEAGGNVVMPAPCYPTQAALPKAFGLEVRSYHLNRDAGFKIDLDEVVSLVDERTKVLVVNVPHNPTGAVLSNEEMRVLHDLALDRGAQFVSDEVHHPIFHGTPVASASRLPCATTIGDLSKSFAMPGLRLGWIIEPDARRRAAYGNVREYTSISNSVVTELIAEIAVRHRDEVWTRTRRVAQANLGVLDAIFAEVSEHVGWIRPSGGMTGFSWFRSGVQTRPFCEVAARHGLLLVPGDCVGAPDHVRIGFGAQETDFEAAAETFARLLQEHIVR